MPITWLDMLLLGIMLISGLLAMIRGFIREILSIAAWAGAAAATILLYGPLLPIAKANISSDIVATGVVIGGVFLLTLLIVSSVTVRISDKVLDSRIGALDRTLGFLFGLGRGLIIVVVAFLFFAWLVPAGKRTFGRVTSIDDLGNGKVRVGFAWQWDPNEAGRAIKSSFELHQGTAELGGGGEHPWDLNSVSVDGEWR